MKCAWCDEKPEYLLITCEECERLTEIVMLDTREYLRLKSKADNFDAIISRRARLKAMEIIECHVGES